MVFPSGGDVFYTNFKYHLGSTYIIAYLRENGFNAEQFISKSAYNVKECVKKIMSYNPKIVGFTVYESNYMQCALISDGLKVYNSNVIIIYGGPTPTVQSKEIMETIKSVDLCVRQEGEETVLEILTALINNNFKLNHNISKSIKGITYREEDKIVVNPDCNILFSNRAIKNYLDKYPSPYLSRVIPASKAFPTGILTARGCNQNCIYCNCAVLSKKNIFFHSLNRVITELKYLSDKNIKFLGPVAIYDDTFTAIPERARKICEKIIENNIKLPLQCITRCDMIDRELIDLLKQAGFNSIGFSLESAVPRVLRTIGKVNPPNRPDSYSFKREINFIDNLKEMTSYAKKIGFVNVFVSIMVGLPGETIQEAQKTMDLINSLKIDVYTHNYLHIYKGTPLYRDFENYGYEVKPIGQNNIVLQDNDFPFDVFKIKLGDKCSKITDSKIIDYDTLNILSLNPRREIPEPFFKNVIIDSKILKPTLVCWLQQNLALNGTIIQIYPDEKEYIKHHDKNKEVLYDNFTPTMNYQPYFWENHEDFSILRSGRKVYYGEKATLGINVKNTNSALKDYKKRYKKFEYLICQDRSLEDSEALYKLLIKILNCKDSFNYLLKRKPLPQIQNLCRWTANQANCHKLETVILDDRDFIRMCWYSDPIGKIGSSFTNITKKIQNIRDKIMLERNCIQCIRNETCVKCLFPFPLSGEQYCQYRIIHDTNKPANFINGFYVANDLLLKPLNLFDF